jgi:hypothetical protein
MVIALVALIALLITSVQVSMQPRLSILNETAVYRLHPDEVYEEAVSKSLRGSWTNSNKITINTARIASDLKRSFPEVADASVALPVLGQRPLVYIQLTKPSLILVSTDGSAAVLDEKGRVLAPASQVDDLDSLKLPTVSDESGLSRQTGSLALSSGSMQFIQTLLYQLKVAGIDFSRLVLPAASQELDVYVHGGAYHGKFNLHAEDTAREQAGSFIATAAYLKKQGTAPKSYIDSRVPGRSYYK